MSSDNLRVSIYSRPLLEPHILLTCVQLLSLLSLPNYHIMAMILDAFVSNFLDILFTFAKEEAAKVLGVQDEVVRLRQRLERISNSLADAERRQLQDQSINRWVCELKDIMYDAQDIIDECRIEGENRIASLSPSVGGLVRPSHTLCSCFPRFVFRLKIARRIKSLNLRLEELSQDKAALTLTPTPHEDRIISKISRRTSPVADPFLVGTQIEDHTKELVELLTREHKQKIPVFAVVGTGGIGKTTLAQKIYNEEKLLAEFDPIKPVWVCVSQAFDENKILRDIVKDLGGKPSEHQDKTELEPLLCQVVRNKKLFLVLDDVWDACIWKDLLLKPLYNAGVGSRILVTTRSETIAKMMGAVYVHRVETLSDDDSWSLLCKMVFQEEDEREMQNLKDIGMRIVQKCDGLPLAVKTIAGVPSTKDKRKSEWEKVLRSPAWSLTELPEGVMGALYLSYEDLPPHLKQLFVYFSLFPEDTLMYRYQMVQMWIAEGFVAAKGDISMEEEGEQCWKELMERSLLQPHPGYYDNSWCRMHDLVRSLALHLAQDENYCGDERGLNNRIVSSSLVKLRRLWIQDEEAKVIPDRVSEQASLRTLIFRNLQNISQHDFRKLKHLRVLDLSWSHIEKLPDSIGNLTYLRFLDLCGSKIREIPQCMGHLRNLQILRLTKCRELQSLPKSITLLSNLRYLDVEKTQLDSMPIRISKLTHLRALWGFIVSLHDTGNATEDMEKCTLEELKPLSQLRQLSIFKLERASSKSQARTASLVTKPHLCHLELRCTRSPYNEEEIRRIQEVFSELCPPQSIEILDIRGYFGRHYPSWMMEMSASFLPNLRRLVLYNCNACPKLPHELALLPQLYYLWIKGASAVASVGPELFLPGVNASAKEGEGSSSSYSFPKLEVLGFENMPNWEEWRWLDEEEDQKLNLVLLPRLRRLVLDGCPKLRSLPEVLLHHATQLEELFIRRASCMEEIKNLHSVKDLHIMENFNLKRASDLASLKILKVICCRDLRDMENLNQLQRLLLEDPEMESLPEWLLAAGGQLQFPLLQRLVIEGNSNLLLRCLINGPDWPKIRDIPQVTARTSDGSAYISYTKAPFTFQTNLRNKRHDEESPSKQ